LKQERVFDENGIPKIRVVADYPTSKALKLHPDLRNHLKSTDPPRIKNEDRETLLLYNKYIAKDLYDIDIEFAEHAIIPTPIMRYNFLMHVIKPNSSIIEIGTGASAIIAMLGAKHFNAQVYATEVDKEYIKLANQNIKRNNLESKITVIDSQGSFFNNVVPSGLKVDFIISNPPYYDKILSPKVIWGGKNHELVGEGEMGESFILRMIKEGWDYLKSPGTISFIIPKTRQNTLIAVEDFLNSHNYDYDIIGLLAGNRTRFIFRIFKNNLLDINRLSEMD